MKQELFETISQITGHDCVDSELNEIIDTVQAVHVRMDVEALKCMIRPVFQEVLQLVEAVREKQHEATKEAVYALYCDCCGEINEEDLNILEMP